MKKSSFWKGRKKTVHALFAAAGIASCLLTGCTTVRPGYGIGGDAVVPNVRMESRGEAAGVYLFGLLPMGACDASLATAAKNGGITKIATVNTKIKNVLGLIVTRTTIVTGE